jgi:aerobic C4-dicarboxylate transport protein
MIEKTSHVLFHRRHHHEAAPIGAFGAMAFTIGKRHRLARAAGQADGHVLRDVPALLFVVLGLIAACTASDRFIRYIKEELLIVLGTQLGSVLPRMMAKMENAGAKVGGRLIPPATPSTSTARRSTDDGAVFIAQATNTPMTFGQELTLLRALLTSKAPPASPAAYRPGGDARRSATCRRRAADPRHRPLHVDARLDKLDRQRRRHDRGRQVDG